MASPSQITLARNSPRVWSVPTCDRGSKGMRTFEIGIQGNKIKFALLLRDRITFKSEAAYKRKGWQLSGQIRTNVAFICSRFQLSIFKWKSLLVQREIFIFIRTIYVSQSTLLHELRTRAIARNYV
jgi:hypothetical protein